MTALFADVGSLRAQDEDQVEAHGEDSSLSGAADSTVVEKSGKKAQSDSDEKQAVGSEDTIVAWVGRQPIRWSDVLYRWRSMGLNEIPQPQAVDPILLRESVTRIAQQRIAMAELDRRKLGAMNAEADQLIQQRVAAIEGGGVSAEDLARREGLSLTQWRQELRWQMSWQRYLKDRLSDEKLKEHFESKRIRFDGTELEVFHILIKCDAEDAKTRKEAKLRLEQTRESIVNGTASFEDLAKLISQGATAKEGGRLGWLEYEGAMPPEFNRAAFTLKSGEVSQPVETLFGMHLIWVKSIELGTKDFGRAITAVRRSLLESLFDDVVRSYPSPPKIYYQRHEDPNDAEK